MKYLHFLLILFFFKNFSQDTNYEFYNSLHNGDITTFDMTFPQYNYNEFPLRLIQSREYGNSFLFDETEIRTNVNISNQDDLFTTSFNILEFIASRFSGNPKTAIAMINVVHKYSTELFKEPNILSRALCPWIPHIQLGSYPSAQVVEHLLSKGIDPNEGQSENLGTTPLDDLLLFKANMPMYPDDEFKKIFVLLIRHNAKRIFLGKEGIRFDKNTDPNLHKILEHNRELAIWIRLNYIHS